MNYCQRNVNRSVGLLFLCVAFLWANSVFAARTALVIGNAAYPGISETSLFGVLDNPVNDAERITEVLDRYGFEVLLVTDADQQKMEGALKLFLRQLEQDGVGLLYFSGHGVQVEDANYLIPVGQALQDAQDVRQYALNAQLALEKMTAAGPQVNIMILDACREHMPLIMSKSVPPRGLAKMDGAVGSIIAYATDPGNVAYDVYDDATQKNSLYTQYLLDAMEQGEWPVELVFKQAQMAVAKVTERGQVPWVESGLISQFCFSSCGSLETFDAAVTELQASAVPALRTPNPQNMRLEVERRILANLQAYERMKNGKSRTPIRDMLTILTHIIDDMYIYEVYHVQLNPDTAETIRAMRQQYEAELRRLEESG